MSTKFTLNSIDFGNALKNFIIFGLPLFMSNLPVIQNYLVGLWISPELCSIMLSTLIKLLQYYVEWPKKEVK